MTIQKYSRWSRNTLVKRETFQTLKMRTEMLSVAVTDLVIMVSESWHLLGSPFKRWPSAARSNLNNLQNMNWHIMTETCSAF